MDGPLASSWLGRAAGQACAYVLFLVAGLEALSRMHLLAERWLTGRTTLELAVFFVGCLAVRAVRERRHREE